MQRRLRPGSDGGGGGIEEEDEVSGGGDTFVLRAYSSDVLLQTPILREQSSHARYSGALYVADSGNYTVEIYWSNTGYAGWFDLNEHIMGDVAASEGAVLRAAAGTAPPTAGVGGMAGAGTYGGVGHDASHSSSNRAIISSISISGHSISGHSSGGDGGGSNASSAGRLCPHNGGMFSQRHADEHRAHWAANLSVPNSSLTEHLTESSAMSPPPAASQPKACTSGIASGRWVGRDWAPFSCFLLRYTRVMLEQCAARRPLRIVLYGDSILRGLYFDLAELLTEQKMDRAWAKRHAGPGERRAALPPTPNPGSIPSPHPNTNTSTSTSTLIPTPARSRTPSRNANTNLAPNPSPTTPTQARARGSRQRVVTSPSRGPGGPSTRRHVTHTSGATPLHPSSQTGPWLIGTRWCSSALRRTTCATARCVSIKRRSPMWRRNCSAPRRAQRCSGSSAGHTHTHKCHACTHAHTHARTHACTHAHTHVCMQVFWLVSAANHLHDDNLDCAIEESSPTHKMAFHRSLLFSAAGAEAMRGVTPMIDMWKPTADQAARCAKVHYDELYVQEEGGLVSRTVANLLLNAACNVRILPQSELSAGLP